MARKWSLMLRVACWAVLVGLLAASGPQKSRDGEAPVPYLNRDGTIPKGQDSESVFLDPNTGDGVVIYRPYVDGRLGATPIRVNVPLARHVEPSISIVIEYDDASRSFNYRYTLRNGANARQPAYLWFFRGLVSGDSIQVKAPSQWICHFPDRPSASNIAFQSLALMVRNVPTSPPVISERRGVPPGEERTGLELISKLIPGLIEVYAQGNAQIAEFPDEPPDTVQGPVGLLMGFPYNYRRTLTFGPKYPEGTGRAELSLQYLKDLEALGTANAVDTGAPFYSLAKTVLERMIQGAIDTRELEALRTAARFAKEKEFAAAAALAFSAVDSR